MANTVYKQNMLTRNIYKLSENSPRCFGKEFVYEDENGTVIVLFNESDKNTQFRVVSNNKLYFYQFQASLSCNNIAVKLMARNILKEVKDENNR